MAGVIPGELLTDGPDLVINPGRRTAIVTVENTGVRVSSFWALKFDR